MNVIDKRNVLLLSSLALLGVSVLLMKRINNRRKRRFKIRPMNRMRHINGHFATLVRDMQNVELDSAQFVKYTRMMPSVFQRLVELVGPSIKKDARKNPLSVEHRLIMTLHYLAEGCSMQDIAWSYRVGKSTAHGIIKETMEALWINLMPIVLPEPTRERFEEIATDFYDRWNMPNCIGAVDGKHVSIQAPKYSGSEYFNYKKTFSLVLLATCDAKYRFTMIDIGAAGSNHDSTVFKESSFGIAFLNGHLEIPPPRKLPNTDIEMNHFIVADQAFPLSSYIMRPYPGKNLEVKKNIFNYRLSRARRTIENSFGILVQRWRILRKPIVASVETCESVIKATVVLHNYIMMEVPSTEPSGNDKSQGPYETILRPVHRLASNNFRNCDQQRRDMLADYFMTAQGSISNQWDYISVGSAPTNV